MSTHSVNQVSVKFAHKLRANHISIRRVRVKVGKGIGKARYRWVSKLGVRRYRWALLHLNRKRYTHLLMSRRISA